jgi:hypothetical protein
MRLAIAEKIEHQTQPTPCSCVVTCLAMALGLPVLELVAQIGTISIDRSFGPETFAIWLAERGIWMRPTMNSAYGRGERIYQGSVYLVGVRSLNLVNADHSVLLDTRGPRLEGPNYNERSGWKLFEPNAGREGVTAYDWVDEYVALDMHELRDRNCVGGAIGHPP